MSSAIALHFSKLAFVLFVTATQGFKVNITKFENCFDVGEVKVNLTSVQYDCNDEGLCDTIHGKYYVHTRDPGLNYELWMSLFQCSTTTVHQCNENERKYVEPLLCVPGKGFRSKNIGPWYILAKAIKGCGEEIGDFDLASASLLPEYLTGHMVIDPNLGTLRIQMLFHKIGDGRMNPRGCVNIEFNLIV